MFNDCFSSSPQADIACIDSNASMLRDQANILQATQEMLQKIFRYDPTQYQKDHDNSKGQWSQEEDQLLKNAIKTMGETKWRDIAKIVGTRTGKQCRERWLMCLDPNNKRTPFEPWEDQIVMEKQKILGNKWTEIARYLPGRTSGAVKNRWYLYLKKNGNNPVKTTYLSPPGLSQHDFYIGNANINSISEIYPFHDLK